MYSEQPFEISWCFLSKSNNFFFEVIASLNENNEMKKDLKNYKYKSLLSNILVNYFVFSCSFLNEKNMPFFTCVHLCSLVLLGGRSGVRDCPTDPNINCHTWEVYRKEEWECTSLGFSLRYFARNISWKLVVSTCAC